MLRTTIAALAGGLLLSACADVGEAPIAETTIGPDAAAGSGQNALPAGEPVPIDTSASTIEWTAAKVTRTHQGGFRTFSGVVYVDGGTVTGADVTAEVASIYADVDRLTEHLKSDEFFDVAVNPQVRFLVSSLTPITDTAGAAGATHQADGEITMHGRTNRVSFPTTISMDDGAIRATADFIIDRQDWGISYTGAPDDLVNDEVRVRLNVVAQAPGPARTDSLAASL